MDDDDRPLKRLSSRWVLLLGVLGSMSIRVAVTREAQGPWIVADEAGYLAMARHIAGVGEIWNIGEASSYNPGYSILIAPLFWIFGDPVAVFRAVVSLNVLLGGLLVVLYDALARRITTLRPPVTALAAAIAASLPALVLTANHAWSDNLAPLLFAGVLLAGLRLIERPGPLRSITLIVLIAFSFMVHNRLGVLVLPAVILFAELARRREISQIGAALCVGTLALSLVILPRLWAPIQDAVYTPGGRVVKSGFLSRASRVDSLAVSIAGQLWYLLATTVGVAGLGIVSLLRKLVESPRGDRTRPGEERRSERDRRGLARGSRTRAPSLAFVYTSATVLLSFGVSAVFMTDRPRSDHLVYGRYNDAMVGVLVLLGISWLCSDRVSRRSRLRGAGAVVAATLACGAFVRLMRPELLRSPGASGTVLGTLAFDPHLAQIRKTSITAAALLIALLSLIGVIRTSRLHRSTATGAVLVVLLLVGVQRADEAYPTWRSAVGASTATAAPLLERGDELWAALGDGGDSTNVRRLPSYLDEVKVRYGNASEVWATGPELVLADFTSDRGPAAGYRVIWVDARSNLAIWVAPGDRQQAHAVRGELFADPPSEPLPGDDGARLDLTDVRTTEAALTADLTIERPPTGPWAGRDPLFGPPATDRVRVRVVGTHRSSGREVLTEDFDIGYFVPADQTRIEVPLRVDLPRVPDGKIDLRLTLTRGDGDPFGAPLLHHVTIGPFSG